MIDDAWLEETKTINKINKGNRVADIKIFKNVIVKKHQEFGVKDNEIKQINCDKVIKKGESLGIDRGLDKKLKNGDFSIDLKVDFHGMTLDEAFEHLIYVVNYAYNNGLRFLLLITGKGSGTKDGRETIKSMMEHWFIHKDIVGKVIKYVDAKHKDGGTGALYVLIKRNNNYKSYY
ncbi:MAG: Smr/MutS family protein [Rickettsiales bacterium]|nr:Smr/MutS family protein [Rickettsiales bacterium]